MTNKQELFAKEYIKDWNATQAAIRAGYSAKTARVSGQRLLKDPRVKAKIEASKNKLVKNVEVNEEEVLEFLKRVLHADMKDFVDFGPGMMIIKPSDRVDGTIISEISSTPTKNGDAIKFKLYDKLKAAELLGRYLSMWNDKLKVDADVKVKKLEDYFADENS